MKKINIFTAALVAAFMMSSCQMPADDTDNTQTTGSVNQTSQTTAGSEQGEETSSAEPEGETSSEGTENTAEPEEEETGLDLSKLSQYSMKVGEEINLLETIEGCQVYYQIQSGRDAVSISSQSLKATSVGEAIIKAIDWDDESHYWSCSVTVSAEGFSGDAIEYKLCGNWKSDDGVSCITLNQDKTGYMKIYLNSSVVQDCSFNWSASEASSYKILSIINGDSYINKDYTILSVSGTSMRLSGYLAFGKAKETSWTKE